MFFIKILRFIKGYVILDLYGEKKEINLEKIRKLGIHAENIKYSADKIRLCISRSDYKKINIVKTEYVIEKTAGGIYFLQSMLKRKILVSGILVLILSFIVGSNFIWTVEFQGVSESNMEMVTDAVEKAGVKIGAKKSGLMTPLELKNTILANTDGISWCWVYIKGTRAVVDVRENIIPPTVFSPDTPCNIVASKDGIIKKVITKRGKCIAEDNQAVASGDVLISGDVTFGEGEGYQVHASGECFAKTFYQREGVYKLYKNYKTYTGKKRNFLTLKLFGWRVPLYFNGDIDFKYCDKKEKMYEISIGKDNYIGLGLEKISFFEYNIMREPISVETCTELAGRELEKEIAGELLPGSILENSELSSEKIDEETISVKLIMEFTEEIGTENFIEEVKLIEPKTD